MSIIVVARESAISVACFPEVTVAGTHLRVSGIVQGIPIEVTGLAVLVNVISITVAGLAALVCVISITVFGLWSLTGIAVAGRG